MLYWFSFRENFKKFTHKNKENLLNIKYYVHLLNNLVCFNLKTVKCLNYRIPDLTFLMNNIRE